MVKFIIGLLILVIAVFSNLLQYVSDRNPMFLGISGVNYGLLGYIWMQKTFNPSSGFLVSDSTIVILLLFLVFGFGLLHGMGFAGVLHELGLPEGQLATALISFNVGVELGQLAVILLAFLAIGVWFRNRSWYRQLVVIPFSLLIALVGLYWFIERLA